MLNLSKLSELDLSAIDVRRITTEERDAVGLDKRGAIVLQQKVSHVADAPRQTGPSKPPSQGTPARAVKPGTKGGHKAHH
jgi:hypothetical protein